MKKWLTKEEFYKLVQLTLTIEEITSECLVTYLKAKGWILLDEAINDGIYVLSNPSFPRRQIVLPIDINAKDYNDAVSLALEKLSEIYEKDIISILTELKQGAI